MFVGRRPGVTGTGRRRGHDVTRPDRQEASNKAEIEPVGASNCQREDTARPVVIGTAGGDRHGRW